ncbi:MAG: hypothetical protein EOP39_15735 [Rubrivivax sp.]|nr:MAG: hypothetical protein EOP39_15735 [Rubrivivax sp.]
MNHEATLRALPEPDLTMPSVEPDGPDGAHYYRASTVRAIAAQAVADHIAANTAPTGAEPNAG